MNPNTVIVALPDGEALADGLAAELELPRRALDIHQFPDGELCPRVDPAVAGADVIVACPLDHPNQRLAAALLGCGTLREAGAARILLVIPYLPYMRQDRAFEPGQGTSARHFAEFLSPLCDGFITVDPHLHRIHDLSEVYRVPSTVVAAAPALAGWIEANVRQPLLIGPDGESEQWVANVAGRIGAPFRVLSKQRFGDHDVRISVPQIAGLEDHQPVLVDDIVSSATTLITASGLLCDAGLKPPICVCVHALCTQEAEQRLLQAGAARLVSSNSIAHSSNAIDLTSLLARAVRDWLR